MDAVADLAIGKPGGVLANIVLRQETIISPERIGKHFREGDLFNLGPLSCDFGFDYLKAVEKVTKENTERLISLVKEQDDYIRKNEITLPGYSGFVIFNTPEFDDEGFFVRSGAIEKIFTEPRRPASEKDVHEVGREQEEPLKVYAEEINDADSNTREEDSTESEPIAKGPGKIASELGWNSDEEQEEIPGNDSSDPSSYPIRYFPDRETTKLLEGDLSICNDDRSEKDKEYPQIYSAGLEESEDSELPCSSKSVSKSPDPAETCPVGDHFRKPTVRSYSRKDVMAARRSKEKTRAPKATKTKSRDPEQTDVPETEPLFVISSVMGNADFAFEDVPDESSSDLWPKDGEESDRFFTGDNHSTITPKKTNDITKIKGWRKKQFKVGQTSPGTTEDYFEDDVSNSEDGTGYDSKEARHSIYPYTIVKQEPVDPEEEVPADSAFVCDSLDDFLDKEADLNINYEIPHLYAEVGIKLTSEEIVSRPKISGAGPEPESVSSISSGELIENLLADERPGLRFSNTLKRTDNRKMQARCLKNLIDHRYHYVSSGGKVIKVAGSYDSRPLKGHEGKPSKSALWANEARSFDDIFNDLMQDDSVEEERGVDKSVVLLHRKKPVVADFPRPSTNESPQKIPPSILKEKSIETPVRETASETEPEEIYTIPEKEKTFHVRNKLVGLAVYPGPFSPLPSVVQYHLRKMRNYRTKIDKEWANFATSALSVGKEPAKRKRMILPVVCPVVCRVGDEDDRSDFTEVLDRFRKGDYYNNFEKDVDKREASKEVRNLVDNLLKTVARKVGKDEQTKKKRGGKRGKSIQISESQIISSDEKRTRRIPGKYKDTTLLKEKELPSSLKSNDFSSTVVALPEAPRKTYAKRRLEKMKELKARYNILECKVVMHKMKGLARVAPWCMKHECYSCQPCRLKNPFSSKFFKMPNSKRRRPNPPGIKDSSGKRNIAVKRTAPLREPYAVPSLAVDNVWKDAVLEDPEKRQQQQQHQKRFTLESVFEESERSRLDNNQSVKQITFNKVVTKLLSEKLRDLKSTKHFTSSIDNLRHLRPNVIELIKLNLVQESFSSGYVKIWYLKGKTSTKSRAFLTFSKYPPVDGAVNLKSTSGFSTQDLPKVITEIISDKSRFDPDDYAILHCDGSLWEIHGSVNFTVEKNEELERPIEETKIIYADEVIVSELRFMSRLHPGKVFDNPAKWWIIDMSQEYLEILTRVDGKIFKFQRDDIMKYMELKVFRFVNIGRNGSPIFGTYLIPSIFPYGLIGPYHLHENHGLELKIHGKSVPFTYYEPGPGAPRRYPDVVPAYREPEDPPDVAFGLKHLIRSTIADFKKAHKEIVGLWLHDKTMKKEPSFLEVQTRLKRMSPITTKRRSGYDFTMDHDYSLSPRDERSDVEIENPSEALRASRTSGVEQSRNFFGKRKNDLESTPEYNVYLVPDIPNLGYIKGQLMSDQSVTINHPLTPNKLINSLKMDEWLNNFLKQKIQFIPKDLKINWARVTNPEDIRDQKPLNKFCLGGTHILCQKGLFYMLSMNKTMLEKLGLDKSDVLKAISDSTIIKEVMEVKELGKLVTMEDECNLSISEVLELAIKEVKGLEARGEELVKLKAATEKRKWKLCRQYMEALRSCNIHSTVKKKLFSNLKKQLLAIQEERKKSDSSPATGNKRTGFRPIRPVNSGEVSDDTEIEVEVVPEDKGKKKKASTKNESRKFEKPARTETQVFKSPGKKVSVIDPTKVRAPEIEIVEEEINDVIDVEACAISPHYVSEVVVEIETETETEVPRAAAEETVCSANDADCGGIDRGDIKKLEAKLANIYQLLRTKTRPEDAEEYQSLLTRLSLISQQLETMKSQVAELASPKGPVFVTHGNVTVTVTDDRRALQPVQTPSQCLEPQPMPPQPTWQITRMPPSMQPKSADPSQPLYVITVNSDPEPNKASSRKSLFGHSPSLESTVVNGNKRFKIERKLEKAAQSQEEIPQTKEPRYVINKPYFPPETATARTTPDRKTNPSESETNVIEESVVVDDDEVWEEAHEEMVELSKNSKTVHSFTSPKQASNFLISISKDSGKKICIVRKCQSEEGSEPEKTKENEKKKLEFVPLTSLNAARNVTIRRELHEKNKPQIEIFPATSKTTTLKPVTANRPSQKSVYFFPSANELSDNLSGEKSGGSELEGKRKPSVSICYPPSKKSKIYLNSVTSDAVSGSSSEEKTSTEFDSAVKESLDSSKEKGKGIDAVVLGNDDETSWLTMNAEDIEKNFQKLIEPITRDLQDEKKDESLNDGKAQASTVSTNPLSNDTAVNLNR